MLELPGEMITNGQDSLRASNCLCSRAIFYIHTFISEDSVRDKTVVMLAPGTHNWPSVDLLCLWQSHIKMAYPIWWTCNNVSEMVSWLSATRTWTNNVPAYSLSCLHSLRHYMRVMLHKVNARDFPWPLFTPDNVGWQAVSGLTFCIYGWQFGDYSCW